MKGRIYVIAMLWLCRCAGTIPDDLGWNRGFAECPSSPNCVSSLSGDADHFIQPFDYASMNVDSSKAMATLVDILHGMPRVQIVRMDPDYVHAAFSSRIWGFVDDAEFRNDSKHRRIHVKSRSRIGYSDFGVNRRRIESIRIRWRSRLLK